LRILIVEDETRISTLLKMYLQRESYQVDVEHNGEDGLTRALNEDYDLILLDVFMPGKNGFQVLEELRKSKETPVILLTAQNGEEDQQRAAELGASGFISKPFSPGDVVSKVRELLAN
jgi:DNA-binding response OmpR family regulator